MSLFAAQEHAPLGGSLELIIFDDAKMMTHRSTQVDPVLYNGGFLNCWKGFIVQNRAGENFQVHAVLKSHGALLPSMVYNLLVVHRYQ